MPPFDSLAWTRCYADSVRIVSVFVALVACSNGGPPIIGDSDAAPPHLADAYAPPTPDDAAGVDAGAAFDLDFQGVCLSGQTIVWHFFDFQTHTPGDSSLRFSARTAKTEAALGSAPSVSLGTVTGADITNWTGVDVDPKLQSIGQMSQSFLRVVVVMTPATDAEASAPALVHYRQAFDCVVGQ